MEVLLFGMIAEKAGVDRMKVHAASTHALRQLLAEKIQGLEALSYSIAVDRTIVHNDVPLQGHEEIAVLPPFAGG
ncbi:MAG: MoaD/ThiS family protein [Flavobacteriales bacterium]|nr:MoaD/ThiS family protein [Flavobacteriales bacterium]